MKNFDVFLCAPFVSSPLNTLYSISPISFILSITLPQISARPIHALVDCGASDCFISPELASTVPSALHTLPNPLSLSLFDGSAATAGTISQFLSTLVIYANGFRQKIPLLVTPLHPSVQVVLGLSWLRDLNPVIDWKSLTLAIPSHPKNLPIVAASRDPADLRSAVMDPVEVEMDVMRYLAPWRIPVPPIQSNPPKRSKTRRRLDLWQPPQAEMEENLEQVLPISSVASGAPSEPETGLSPASPADVSKPTIAPLGDRPSPSASLSCPTDETSDSNSTSSHSSTPQGSEAEEDQNDSPTKPPPIRLINAAAFATLLRTQPTVSYGTIYISPMPDGTSSIKLRAADISACPTSKSEAEMLEQRVPKEFHDYADVFSEAEARNMPPHRPYDHAVEMEPGAKAPWGPVYNMSGLELESLRVFLDDMLGKGFIRASHSPAGAPVLFVKKKDGSLRLCVDYRGLNRVTIKNRYPLPLINNIMDRLGKAKYFTKIDLRAGYNNVRIKKGDEWKTAFRTRYGSFEYLVMPFGLTNAPATFQYFMNDVFKDMTDDFVVVYIDDILIYSDNLEEHRRHVRKVLQRLREYNLHAKPEKSEFFRQSIEYLGFLISPQGVEMDPAKVDAVLSWPAPTTVKQVQSFLGFANFYRRFIRDFSKIVRPLTNLTRKAVAFIWSAKCQKAFETLKSAFTTAPILAHYDPDNPTVLETDSSDFAIGSILSQIDRMSGILHPIAFYSRSMIPAEMNYDIYDKELLSIFEAFRQWRPYLEGAADTTLVISDHNNLQYFTTTKQLSRRQARWSEYLSSFNFIIKYRPGRLGTKPDALTRRPDVYPKGEDGAIAQSEPQNFHSFFNPLQIRAAHVIDNASLIFRLRQATQNDEFAQPIIHRLKTQQEPVADDPYQVSDDGLLLRNLRIYVPDRDNLRLEILRQHHDHRLSGHLGIHKTMHLIQRRFYWPRIKRFVTSYIRSCDECIRTKATHHKPFGHLKFLPIPPRPWSSISMDFIEGLPLSEGYDTILVIADRLSKAALFIECHSTDNAPTLAKLYLKHVFSKHGAPSDIVSDRGKLFVSKFWSSLCALLGIKSNLSTAYHPETDGQTERINQILEQYIRLYTNYQQDDWVSLLPLAEFAYNNAPHSATQVSPFFANKGYHPRLEVGVKNVSSFAAQQYAEDLDALHQYLQDQVRLAIEQYAKAAAPRRITPPEFAVGSKVWLSSENIKTKRPSKKLDYRRLGPFEVIQKISTHAVRLRLPDSMKLLHPVFHIRLLEPYIPDPIPNRRHPPPPPVEIDEDLEYEVSAILDSRKRRNRLEYLVEWIGYENTPEHRTWEPADNVANASDYIRDFHRRYPHKPKP